MIAVMFTGQGSQKAGMGKVFYDKYPEVKEIYEKASEVCGYDIPQMCFTENEQLHNTKFAQPCIYTTNYAMYKTIEKKYNPDFFLGLSLGEYNAFQAVGAFSFEDGLKLIKRRGEIMNDAFTTGEHGMIAVLNVTYEKLSELISNFDGKVYIANYNTPKQIVVAGLLQDLDKFSEVLKENKGKAIKLNVSGAFHSPFLNDASLLLAKEFDCINIDNIDNGVISNVTAKAETNVKDTLVKQLTSEVKFCESIQNLINKGVTTFIEVGASKTLTNFVKKIDRNVEVINIEELELNE